MVIMGLGAHDGVPWFLHLLSAPRHQATEEPPATAENLRPFNLVIPFTVQKGEITGMGSGDGTWRVRGFWGSHGPGCGAQWGANQPPPVPG